MSDAGAPLPIEPSVACRNCYAPMPPGATVCERCGASSDFVPKAARVDNTGASLFGVFGAVVFEVGTTVLSKVISYESGGESFVLFVLEIVLPPVVIAIAARVVVGQNSRSSPWRALAYAAGITSLVVLALYVVAAAAVYVICSQSHY